jgi:pimeloyl-ACP methyl ester carboxylesterase
LGAISAFAPSLSRKETHLPMTSRPAQSRTITSGGVAIDIERRGRGPALVMLPGEEDLESGAEFLGELAQRFEVIILRPPGFGASERPDWVTCMDDVAYLYLDILDQLDLHDVTLLGCSLGGWIAAELATKDDARLARLILVDPYGIKVGGPTDRDIADLFLLDPDEVERLRWYDLQRGKRDYLAMPEDELTIIARNRESFARLCWEPFMHNPKLAHRLHRIAVPTLVVWGAHDGIVSPAYGRAYAGLIPGAQFVEIPAAGHYPQIEQPAAFLSAIAPSLEVAHA